VAGYLNPSVTLGFKTPVIVQDRGFLHLEYPQIFSWSYGARRSEALGKLRVRALGRRV